VKSRTYRDITGGRVETHSFTSEKPCVDPRGVLGLIRVTVVLLAVLGRP